MEVGIDIFCFYLPGSLCPRIPLYHLKNDLFFSLSKFMWVLIGLPSILSAKKVFMAHIKPVNNTVYLLPLTYTKPITVHHQPWLKQSDIVFAYGCPADIQ